LPFGKEVMRLSGSAWPRVTPRSAGAPSWVP